MIWLVFAGMTLAALAALIWPLWRPRSAVPEAADIHVALYRAQIAEIDRDVASGRLATTDAQTARAEAGRRLIAENATAPAQTTSASRRIIASGLVVAFCLAGLSLYARIGSPNLADAPLEARRAPENMDFAAALAKIEAHLAKEPDDLRGWTVIAPVYLRLGRTDDAVRAYGNIARLDGDDAGKRADFAEAQIYAANGTVTPAARREFETAFQRDPKSAKARYYLGLAAEQDGDRAKARTIWSALAADAPADSQLATVLAQRVAALDGRAGNPDMAAQITAMPKDAQQTAIRGMVEQLAGRLHENGSDIEGWLRLVRAYRVLDEQDKAKAALADARKSLSDDDSAKTRLDALARELGLES